MAEREIMPWERGSFVVGANGGGALPGAGGLYPWESQALAEAEARLQSPRVFPGTSYAPDAPEALLEELLVPQFGPGIRPQMQRGVSASPMAGFVKSGSRLLKPAMDGGFEVAYEPPDESESQLKKVKYQDLLRQRLAILGNQFRRKVDDERLAEIEKAIAEIEKPAAAPAAPSFVPPTSSSGFIGGKGGTNAFEVGLRMGGLPASTTKRLKFNPASGNLE